MVRKVCVVTGTRAEYGLLRWVMEGVKKSHLLDLQIIVTGAHLSPEFGNTVEEIEQDGFKVNKRVEMLLSADTPTGVAKSMGLGMIGLTDALADLRPDILVLLGDRFEIFSAAAAALVARIPIAHIHGGETTEGAIDEAFRHSITKMANLHFVATKEYRQRVIQLGENPDMVYLVGGLGIDNILRLELLDRKALEETLDFQFGKRNLLVTFHPVTLEQNTARQQMEALIDALDCLQDTHLIFTMPNADTGGRSLFTLLRDFCANRPYAKVFTSLGQLRYLSCMHLVDGVVGNSSSGLLEAPSFRKGTVNIGDRQTGRIKAASVIDCIPEQDAILQAIQKLYSKDFQALLAYVVNPYGEGGACEAIVKALEVQPLEEGLLKKKFHNISSGDV